MCGIIVGLKNKSTKINNRLLGYDHQNDGFRKIIFLN